MTRASPVVPLGINRQEDTTTHGMNIEVVQGEEVRGEGLFRTHEGTTIHLPRIETPFETHFETP
jgi:hypothetical protein